MRSGPLAHARPRPRIPLRPRIPRRPTRASLTSARPLQPQRPSRPVTPRRRTRPRGVAASIAGLSAIAVLSGAAVAAGGSEPVGRAPRPATTAAGRAAAPPAAVADRPDPAPRHGILDLALVPRPAPAPRPSPRARSAPSAPRRTSAAPARAGAGMAAGATFTWTASYYDEGAGASTASGEPFDPGAMTAAHKTLPFGTLLRVTNPRTGQSMVVRINDRGPFVAGRQLDLSGAAARAIGLAAEGVGPVLVQVLRRG